MILIRQKAAEKGKPLLSRQKRKMFFAAKQVNVLPLKGWLPFCLLSNGTIAGLSDWRRDRDQRIIYCRDKEKKIRNRN